VGGLRGAAYSPYYNAAKHGIIGFTKSVAIEMAAEKIRVNVICPGLTRSAMSETYYDNRVDDMVSHVPLGRIGEPEDQASAVVWLCSDNASFITGAVLSVDGGQMAGSPLSLKPGERYSRQIAEGGQ
jgi:NAD(P)-dependent dehydrogenase (short-subunit alcohol dehydrogenase family)